MNLLVVWLTAAMLAWSPPQPSKIGPESERYATIARSVLDIAFDPVEKPLFAGMTGRAKTALQILAIAGFESNFREDVQYGTKRGKAGDACLMQIIVPRSKTLRLNELSYEWIPAKSEERGFTADDLVGPDTHSYFRADLHMVRESFQICGDLSMYTNGKCNHETKAKHREMRAKQHYKMHPAPVSDAVALSQGHS